MRTPRLVHQSVLYTSAIVSLIGNGLLIFVVLHKDSTILGGYRALLVAFACTDITVSLVHAYALPVFVGIEYGLVGFLLETVNLPWWRSYFVISLATALFYVSFPLLTCHFIYRYVALVKLDLLNKHFVKFIFFSAIINITFTSVIIYDNWLCHQNAVDHFFDEVLLEEYAIDVRRPDAPPMIFLNYLVITRALSFLTYTRWIVELEQLQSSDKLRHGSVNHPCDECVLRIAHCHRAAHFEAFGVHKEDSAATIPRIDSAVPFLMCTVPFAFIILSPLTGRRYGQAPTLIGMLVSVFPAIDPILVLCSMPRFRIILIGWGRRVACGVVPQKIINVHTCTSHH